MLGAICTYKESCLTPIGRISIVLKRPSSKQKLGAGSSNLWDTPSHAFLAAFLDIMYLSTAWIFLVAAVASHTFAGPIPVVLTDSGTSTAVDQDSGLDTALRLHRISTTDLRDMQGPPHEAPLALGSNIPLPHAKPSSPRPNIAPFHVHLSPLPTVRSDIAKSFLSDRFSLSSNVPLQLILGPADRKAVYAMGEAHLGHQSGTWLHAIVDEPQFDLSYKKQLYIAAPIARYDWRKAVGLPKSPTTSKWLPVVFYKANLDPDRRNHFKLAGIEVVRDVDEGLKVIREWDSPDTLKSIGRQFGMGVFHHPVLA